MLAPRRIPAGRFRLIRAGIHCMDSIGAIQRYVAYESNARQCMKQELTASTLLGHGPH